MTVKLLAGLALAAAVAGSATAQETVYWPAPRVESGQYAMFPLGTRLTLATRTELSSRSARVGERVNLELAEPLVYRGQTVVPAGALAVGEVRRVEGNAMFGKGGRVELQLRYLHTPHGPVRLTGLESRVGRGQRTLAIGGMLFVAWPMMFIQGRSGRLPAQTQVTAQLLDDLRFPVDSVAQLAAR